jgi:hypothetical protein
MAPTSNAALPLGVLSALAALLLAPNAAWATWAVILADEDTGEVGIGQATCVQGIDLRSLSAVVVPARGVATVQAFVDGSGVARSTIRDELIAGTPAMQILDVLAATDPQHETHQYCIVGVDGGAATYTGVQAQGLSFAGGQIGLTGSIRYCVAGNVLTGAPVVTEAIDAVVETDGSLADRLMAAMEAARGMGGDGRCSCSPGDPTGCGSPPALFDASAINGYLVVARTGDTEDCAMCSGGDYYLDLNVAGAPAGAIDPVLRLQARYDQFVTTRAGRPDAILSTVSFDPPALVPDGLSTTTMTVTLLDIGGAPVAPVQSLTVEQAPGSDEVTAIGAPVDQGGGVYTVPIAAGSTAGIDAFRIAADDGIRPALLMPDPRLGVGVPGEVADVRWSDPQTLVWDAALAGAAYNVYRGGLDLVSCDFLGTCATGLDADATDLAFEDTLEPLAGTGVFYLVTGVDETGLEGTLGVSACGLRSGSEACR